MKYNGLFLVPKLGENKPMEHEAQTKRRRLRDLGSTWKVSAKDSKPAAKSGSSTRPRVRVVSC